MPVLLKVEEDVPVPGAGFRHAATLEQTVDAAASTVELLAEAGLEFMPGAEDIEEARNIFDAWAEAPDEAERLVTPERLGELAPATMLVVDTLMKQFGEKMVHDATQLRHYVTNRLLLETDNKDPKIRLKALELLGKISTVGLFADRTEITMTHQSAEDLRTRLRTKLMKLVTVEPPPQVPDAEIIPPDA